MNLYWPECVPYRSKREEVSTQFGSERSSILKTKNTASAKLDIEDANNLSPETSTSAFPNIYETPLQDDELRVLWLSAVKDPNSPIHVELETYQRDSCPEYETTSYAWGGKDGDNGMCCPVYIGEY